MWPYSLLCNVRRVITVSVATPAIQMGQKACAQAAVQIDGTTEREERGRGKGEKGKELDNHNL